MLKSGSVMRCLAHSQRDVLHGRDGQAMPTTAAPLPVPVVVAAHCARPMVMMAVMARMVTNRII